MFDPQACEFWLNPSLQNYLREGLQAQLSPDFFGEPLPWSEVSSLFPFDSPAEVRDLETGLTFRVKRYGGNSHTDVEPLTTQDTAILEKINGGAWSWNRRAAVVNIAGKKIAASMNGMPHGNGTVSGNDFSGHFCIHYLGSRVHTSGKIDAGHQLMVKKAAGQLAEAIEQATPEELATMVLAGIHYADTVSVRYAAGELKPDSLWQDLTTLIRYLTINNTQLLDKNEKNARVTTDVTVYFYQPTPDTPYRKIFTMNFSKRNSGKGWQVDLTSLKPLLDQEKNMDNNPPAQTLTVDEQEASLCCTSGGEVEKPAD
jgi:hypothetical protein